MKKIVRILGVYIIFIIVCGICARVSAQDQPGFVSQARTEIALAICERKSTEALYQILVRDFSDIEAVRTSCVLEMKGIRTLTGVSIDENTSQIPKLETLSAYDYSRILYWLTSDIRATSRPQWVYDVRLLQPLRGTRVLQDLELITYYELSLANSRLSTSLSTATEMLGKTSPQTREVILDSLRNGEVSTESMVLRQLMCDVYLSLSEDPALVLSLCAESLPQDRFEPRYLAIRALSQYNACSKVWSDPSLRSFLIKELRREPTIDNRSEALLRFLGDRLDVPFVREQFAEILNDPKPFEFARLDIYLVAAMRSGVNDPKLLASVGRWASLWRRIEQQKYVGVRRVRIPFLESFFRRQELTFFVNPER